MKRLNALILLISLTALPAPLNMNAEQHPSNLNSATEFGIDSGRNYSGEEVARMLSVIAEETDRAVDRAYAEGYKAALMETAPENARLRVANDVLNMQLTEERKKVSRAWWVIPVTFLAGGTAGFLTGTLTSR